MFEDLHNLGGKNVILLARHGVALAAQTCEPGLDLADYDRRDLEDLVAGLQGGAEPAIRTFALCSIAVLNGDVLKTKTPRMLQLKTMSLAAA